MAPAAKAKAKTVAQIQADIAKQRTVLTRMDKRVNDLRHAHRVARERIKELEAELATAQAAEQQRQFQELLAGHGVTDVAALKTLLNQHYTDAIALPDVPGGASSTQPPT